MPRSFACVYVGTKNKLDVVYSSTRRRSPGSSTAKKPTLRGDKSHSSSRNSTSGSVASDSHDNDAVCIDAPLSHQPESPVKWSPRTPIATTVPIDLSITTNSNDTDDEENEDDDEELEDNSEPPVADVDFDGPLAPDDENESYSGGAETALAAAAAEAFGMLAANPLPDNLLFDVDLLAPSRRRHHQPQPQPPIRSDWVPPSSAMNRSALATPPLPLLPAPSFSPEAVAAADLLPLAPLWPDATAALGVVGSTGSGGGAGGARPVDEGLLLDEHPLFHGPVGYLDLLPLQTLLLAGAVACTGDADLYGLAV
ncbi:hypothetical protein HK405_014082 [Cladochytrium tenue]|nr:hypothetical protein HK405_014082 [Cladochytrium tenue]